MNLAIHKTLAACIERTLNAWLSTDPDAAARLDEIDGRVICFELTTFPIKLYFIPTAGQIHVLADTSRKTDTYVRGRLIDLTSLGAGGQQAGDGSRLFVEGNAAVGHAFQRLLKTGNFDWEELLARKIGDIPAHQIMKGAGQMRRWAERSAGLLGEAAGDYLTEEARLVAGKHAVDRFIREVDSLRDRIETLETRIDNDPKAGR